MKHHLKALKLPAMHEECEKVAAQCGKGQRGSSGVSCFALCELELIGREKRAADRRLKAARVPDPQDDWKTSSSKPSRRSTEFLVSELMRCEYIDKRESVILLGNPGTGKTHLATVLGIAACQQGKKVSLLASHGVGHATDRSHGRIDN